MNMEMIKKIVKASGVLPGEFVLIHYWGEDADKDVANNFLAAVASCGATPFLIQQSRTINRDIFSTANEKCFDERYFNLLSNFDAVLDIFTYRPVVLGYEIGEQGFGLYRQYMAKLFSKLTQCKRFTQIRIPTEANAEESGLEPQDYISRMMKAYDVDYDTIYHECLEKKKSFDGVNQVAVHTGNNCVLTFDLTGREWIIDAGDGDLPCGEIFIAPIEDKTEGKVFFKTLFIEDFGKYDNVILEIENGKVSRSNNADVTEYFGKLADNEKVVCELGFGMNPNIKELCGYTLLDEKTIGTFHIAIGANTMFGGSNEAPLHIDFVGYGEINLRERIE